MIKFIYKIKFNFCQIKDITKGKIMNNDLSKSNNDNYIPILDFIGMRQFFIFERMKMNSAY